MGGARPRAGKMSFRRAPVVHAPTQPTTIAYGIPHLLPRLTGFFTLYIQFHMLHPDFRGHRMTWGWAFGLLLAVIVGQGSVLIYRTF